MKNISDYESIHNVSRLYLIVGTVDGYIEKSNGNKDSGFASPDKNKEVLTKYSKLWDGIKISIKK